MTAENVENQIKFETRSLGEDTILVRAYLNVTVDGHICREMLQEHPKAQHEMEMQLREQLMRILYEDQTQELFRAVMDYMEVSPFDFGKLSHAREKLFRVAIRQKPLAR